MRLDHIAIRSFDRKAAADFFCQAFKYKFATEFVVDFPDGTQAEAIVLEPSEKIKDVRTAEFIFPSNFEMGTFSGNTYHIPPEIFISDGVEGSIVYNWCKANIRPGTIGAIHHMAYNVEDVRATMLEWQANGWAEFLGDVLTCPEDELDQIFTKPNPYTGIIYEFIKRGKNGFCKSNVANLMLSTKNINEKI